MRITQYLESLDAFKNPTWVVEYREIICFQQRTFLSGSVPDLL